MKIIKKKKPKENQCVTCMNFNARCNGCKIKTPKEVEKVNFSKEKCSEYLINDKLIMF